MIDAVWHGKRVALYARYSSDHQRETSLEDQIRRAEKLAESRGVTIDPALRFLDAAQSGATLHRSGFQTMMAKVEAGAIDIILTEDMSRLSRDLGDAAATLKRLQHRNVVLVGIADGVEYSDEASFMVFGMKAMMSQAYLTDLRYRTRRGLEGRMLAGLSTGGRLLGYGSEPVLGPNGKAIGARILINPDEAKIVRFIFKLSAAGHSLLSIARRLNLDGEAILRPSRKNRKKGWVASTVRAILHNEAYVGRRTYLKKEWHRDPDTGKRRYKKRESGMVVQERPDLRIVDDELWTAVQARLSAVRKKYSKASPEEDSKSERHGRAGRITKYPFSGLLICSCCDTPMVICGGSPHRYYRCGDASKRGICENRLLVQERVVRGAMLNALTEHIASPRAIAYIRKQWATAVGEGSRQAEIDLQKTRARLLRCEQRLRGFAEMWADGLRDPEVKTAWEDAKSEATSLRSTVSSLESATHQPIHLPTPSEVEEKILDLRHLADKAPIEARELLGSLFGDGKIQMFPQSDGSYIARTELLPLVFMAGHQKQSPRSGKPGGFVYIDGCAGRI